jgi:hypothetical protein
MIPGRGPRSDLQITPVSGKFFRYVVKYLREKKNSNISAEKEEKISI